jgi:hypothetical protein
MALVVLVGFGGLTSPILAQDQPKQQVAKLPGPAPIPDVKLGPTLPTIPKARTAPGPNWTTVDATILPKDREGIWILDFAFKPVRMIAVESGGKRRQVMYMYYRVVNRTGKPQMFVPQLSLVTDSGKRYEDVPLPKATVQIQNREDPATPLLGAVDVIGLLPPSTKDGVDDTVYGVAIWDGVDPRADGFKIYVRGLSNGYQMVTPPGGEKPVIRHKTLRIDFSRFGDERNPNEKEIHLLDPPYEWIYW